MQPLLVMVTPGSTVSDGWQSCSMPALSSIAPSVTPGLETEVRPEDSVSVVATGAPANAAPVPPRTWCLGPANCPWCMLQCSHAEHGDLAAAGRKVLSAKAQALDILDEGRSNIAATTGQCLMMGLVACSQQVRAEAPGPATDNALEVLRMQSLLPPLFEAASSSAAPAASQSDAGTSAGTAKEKHFKFSWDDPPDAVWRKGPWIEHDDNQERRIHVNRGKKQRVDQLAGRHHPDIAEAVRHLPTF